MYTRIHANSHKSRRAVGNVCDFAIIFYKYYALDFELKTHSRPGEQGTGKSSRTFTERVGVYCLFLHRNDLLSIARYVRSISPRDL